MTKIIRETYSKWGTLVNKVIIENTTIKKLAEKYDVELEGKSFRIVKDGQTIVYKKWYSEGWSNT